MRINRFSFIMRREQRVVCCGYQFSVCLDALGNVWSFGSGGDGRNGHNTDVGIPKIVEGVQQVCAISCGENFTLCLDANGDVWSFGNNSVLQLGVTDVSGSSVPLKVPDIPKIAQIACGGYFSVCVDNAGSLWTFGLNSLFQCGRKRGSQDSITPGKIPSLDNVEVVVSGGNRTICMTISGEYYGFGYNSQFSISPSTEEKLPPTLLTHFPSDVIAISLGYNHTLMLTQELNVYGYGDNGKGCLGFPSDTISVPLPAPIEGLPPIRYISCGTYHSTCIDEEGFIWTFGAGDSLGYSKEPNADNRPRKLEQPIDVQIMSKGGTHVIAVTTMGELWSWGDSNEGQTGRISTQLIDRIPVEHCIVARQNSKAKSARK